MIWDDHDIFDGWGSYPPHLQNCPVFQGVFFIARKFFCLFQQHSTPERIYHDNGVSDYSSQLHSSIYAACIIVCLPPRPERFPSTCAVTVLVIWTRMYTKWYESPLWRPPLQVFGEYGWSWMSCLGSTTAIVMLDSRTERTREQIIRPATWAMVRERLSMLPSTVRHVIMLTTVPVIYPKIPIVEAALTYMSGGWVGNWLTSGMAAYRSQTPVAYRRRHSSPAACECSMVDHYLWLQFQQCCVW